MEGIIVALIGIVGSVLVVLVEKSRKENSRDHGIVADKLEMIKGAIQDIDDDVAHIEFKLDNHLEGHVNAALGGFDLDDIKYKTGERAKDKKEMKKHGKKKKRNV